MNYSLPFGREPPPSLSKCLKGMISTFSSLSLTLLYGTVASNCWEEQNYESYSFVIVSDRVTIVFII